MKIGQIMIDVYFDQETGIHFSTSPEEVQQGSQSTAKVENSTAMFPEEVHLDPDSDTFKEDKAALKQKGYFFNRSSKTWRKKKGSTTVDETNVSQAPAPAAQAPWYGDASEIQLSQDDPDFARKKESLKSAGFRWDPKAKAWRKSDQ